MERIKGASRQREKRRGWRSGAGPLAHRPLGIVFPSPYTEVVPRLSLNLPFVLESMLYSMRPGQTPRGRILRGIWSLDRYELELSS